MTLVEPADLFDLRGKQWRQVRELTTEEYTAFRAASSRLGAFHKWHESLALVKANQTELEDLIRSAQDITKSSPNLATAQRLLSDEANRQLLNYLATFRFFLDYSDTRLKRTYDADSNVVQAFTDATAHAFDSCFAYRFFYKLRNYAQHCGPPVTHIQTRKQAASPTDMTPVFIVAILLDAHELLREYSDWGRVRPDLETCPQLLEITPLLNDVWERLIEIRAAVVGTERPQLAREGETIEAMYAPVYAAGGKPAVGILRKTGEHTFDVDFVNPPTEVLRWLGIRHDPIRM